MYLKKLWEKELNILPYSLLRALDLIIRSSPLKKIFSCNYISNTDRDLHSLYENYSPKISISKNDKKKLLQKFNLKDDDKIVCVNVRDGAYLKTIYDPKHHNLNHHNYRDCKIENFKETINYLLDLNYKVFRVGVKKENFLDINHKNYFDRSYTLNREDYIDVLLAENCQFCISTGSGFDALPRIFRKPILFVNLLPIINYHSFCKKDLTICKHLYDSKKLSIQDIFYQKFYNGLDTDFYLKNGLQVVENSSNEILIVTKEMIARLNNEFILTKDNLDLQKLIKNKIQNLSKDKFKHGKLLSDFGEDYLRKNFYD
ncbi:TIGR04372 family glycosyltransferase [Candidatus Pelagibacter sp. Uisw_106]|uniref:TIGR04372 family glycosyltransferase n=1 Tax=Candidatus Pelagibacter sp. Uisw_106 TaxID=3230984 RepID=UPI0039EC02E0